MVHNTTREQVVSHVVLIKQLQSELSVRRRLLGNLNRRISVTA